VESPDDIVGHKTIDTGERGEFGMPIFRHEPLTRAEAETLLAQFEAEDKRRRELMPDEQAAIRMMCDTHIRLRELGWREAIYCPKDGSSFLVIEPGSTGIFPCHYHGTWPTGLWWIEKDGGYPSHPVLFKLYPEDQAKRDARMTEVRMRLAKIRDEE
jgi:hypothetical protein